MIDGAKEKKLEYLRQYYKKHAASIEEKRRVRNEQNRERVRAARLANQEKFSARNRKYYAENKIKLRAKRLGLPLSDVLVALEISDRQGRICPHCGVEMTRGGRSGTTECIDHCHLSGKLRAICCHRCNIIKGQAQDDPELLVRIAESLRDFQRKHTEAMK